MLSWPTSPPALSLPQMFRLFDRFIALTLKRTSPCFHLCLCSLRGKFLLPADLFLTSREMQFSRDSGGKAEHISQAAPHLMPTQGQSPPPDRARRKQEDLAQRHPAHVCSPGWLPSPPSTACLRFRMLQSNAYLEPAKQD